MRHNNNRLEIAIEPQFRFNPIPMPSTKEMVKRALPNMPKHDMEDLRTAIRDSYLSRFNRKTTKISKYGGLSKAFTEKQLIAFLNSIPNQKHKLLFSFQANLGFRVGEVIKVNIKDIDFETREIKMHTEKARQWDSLIIPIPLFRELLEFIKSNASSIEQNQGYIFFREAKYSNRKEPYMELNYVRRVFRDYVDMAGLDEIYDISDEHDGRTPRKLHRLTTHSLRHYAITRFARSTNGNVVLTSRFARHRDMSTTSRYIATDKKEIFDVIDSIAVSEVAMLKKKLVGI